MERVEIAIKRVNFHQKEWKSVRQIVDNPEIQEDISPFKFFRFIEFHWIPEKRGSRK